MKGNKSFVCFPLFLRSQTRMMVKIKVSVSQSVTPQLFLAEKKEGNRKF